MTHQATDLNAARRSRSAAVEAAETGPVPAEAQNLPEDTGLLARLLRSPLAGVLLVTVVVAGVGARGLLGGGCPGRRCPAARPGQRVRLVAHLPRGGSLAGHRLRGAGRRLPRSPRAAGNRRPREGRVWWSTCSSCWPSRWRRSGAYRSSRRLTPSRTAASWGALVLRAAPGAHRRRARGSSRHRGGHDRAALAGRTPPSTWRPGTAADRRWRAAWRTSLWLALLTAFVPLAWVIALPLAVLALAGSGRGRTGDSGGRLAVAVPLGGRPRAAAAVERGRPGRTRGPRAGSSRPGCPSAGLTSPLTWSDALFGRPGGSAPWWLSLALVVAAVAALVRPDTRRQVLRCWWVLVVGPGADRRLAPRRSTGHRGATPSRCGWASLWSWPTGAAICAAVLAGTGIREVLSRADFGWRQPVGAMVVVVALVAPWSGCRGGRSRAPTVR